MRRLNAIARALLTTLYLLLCAAPAPAQTVPPARAAESAPATASESAVLNSALNAETFYYLLLGELNAVGGDAPAAFSLYLEAARKNNSAQLYQRATNIALQSRSGELAMQAAQSWRQAQPKSIEAQRTLLQILLVLNRIPETAEPLKATLALSEPAARMQVLQQVPGFYARASDRKAAAAAVQQALADYTQAGSPPGAAAQAWSSVGIMRLAADDRPGALDAARRATAADARSIGAALLALDLFNPKTPAAEELVRRYLAGPSPSADVRLGYARELVQAARYPEASAQLSTLTWVEPALADPWLLQGSIQVQDNQLDAAQASFEKYIELLQSPQRVLSAPERSRGLSQAYLGMSQLYEKRKDFKIAEAWLARIENAEDLIAVRSRRASILIKQGQFEQARAQITSLPARNAAEERARLMAELAVLREAKQYQAGYDLLERAVARDSKDIDLLYDQATFAEKLDRLSEMERLLRQYIADKPDSANAYNALGYSLADRNVRLDEAKKLIQKALELAPGDPFITDSLGWVEFRLGNKAEAQRILEGAYRTRPDPEIGAHLGEVLWSLGQRDKATAIWREAQTLGADNETLIQTLKRLRVRL